MQGTVGQMDAKKETSSRARSAILRTDGRARWPEAMRNFALLTMSELIASAAASSSPFFNALMMSLWCLAFQSALGDGVEK